MSSDRWQLPFLLVEDDLLLGATMRRYLERWSEDVRHAETCEQALGQWLSMPAGLVLMDYRLEDGYGTDVVAKARARGRSDVVVCMTGEAETISEAMRGELGIRRVLTKPVMLDVLRAELESLRGELEALGAEAVEPAGVASVAGAAGAAAAVSASVSGAAGVGSVGGHRYRGAYRLLRWHGVLDGRRLSRLCRVAQQELWVSLELSGLGETEPEGWRGLCAWAGWLSSSGGRLCVVARDEASREQVEREIGAWVDVVGTVEEIEIQSNRLTSRAERRQLLDVVASSAKQRSSDG